MPQSEMITLAHWEGKKKTHRAAGQISRQATGKRPCAPNGQSAPACALRLSVSICLLGEKEKLNKQSKKLFDWYLFFPPKVSIRAARLWQKS